RVDMVRGAIDGDSGERSEGKLGAGVDGRDVGARGIEFLDAPRAVSNEKIPGRVERRGLRKFELPVAAAGAAHRGEESTRGIGFLDPVVARIRDVDVAGGVDGEIADRAHAGELPVAGAGAAELSLVGAGCAELLDAGVAGVDYVDRTAGLVDGDRTRVIE